MNYFQPTFKLLEKTRDGTRVAKLYSPPAAPCDRVMQHDETNDRLKTDLRELLLSSDCVPLNEKRICHRG